MKSRRAYLAACGFLVFILFWYILTMKSSLLTQGRDVAPQKMHAQKPRKPLKLYGLNPDFSGLVEMASKLSTIKSPVILSVINDGYVTILLNWLCNTASMGIHDQILLVVSDDTSEKKIHDLWPEISIVILESNETIRGNQDFATAGYVKILVLRLKIISILVQHRIPLLLLDTDFVWIRNPVPVLEYFTEYDIVGAPLDIRGSRDLNMGFLQIFPSDRNVKLWKKLTEMMTNLWKRLEKLESKHSVPQYDDDQTYLNNLIKKNYANIKVALLPRLKFPVGQWYSLKTEDMKKYQPDIIHNNWIIGNERKIARAKNFGHWFIFEDGRCNTKNVSLVINPTTG